MRQLPLAAMECAMPAISALSILIAASLGHAIAAGVRGAGRGLSQVVSALRNRRAAERLSGLDDRMLADIGLTRSDLRDAYSEPLWQDPTDVLARRAAERRMRHPMPGRCLPPLRRAA